MNQACDVICRSFRRYQTVQRVQTPQLIHGYILQRNQRKHNCSNLVFMISICPSCQRNDDDDSLASTEQFPSSAKTFDRWMIQILQAHVQPQTKYTWLQQLYCKQTPPVPPPVATCAALFAGERVGRRPPLVRFGRRGAYLSQVLPRQVSVRVTGSLCATCGFNFFAPWRRPAEPLCCGGGFGSWRGSATRCASLVDGTPGVCWPCAWSFRISSSFFLKKAVDGEVRSMSITTRKRSAGGYGTVGGRSTAVP
jgi:hypothetical protein